MLIKFNRPSVLGFNGKLLKPGVNDLSSEFVAEMMEDEIIAGKFDKGELEIVNIPGVKTKKNGEEPSAVDRLLKAGEGEAKELAVKTVDLEILKEWASREKRKSVKKVVKMQIAKITNIEYRETSKEKKSSKYEKSEE